MRSFDTIVSIFAQQLENNMNFSVRTENVIFVAEAVSWVARHISACVYLFVCLFACLFACLDQPLTTQKLNIHGFSFLLSERARES